MLRFLTDENIEGHLVKGLLSKNPNLDVIRVQDVGLRTAADPLLMDWAGRNNRILITHDISTISPLVYERIAAGQPLPGIIFIQTGMALGIVIRKILQIAATDQPEAWSGRVEYLTK